MYAAILAILMFGGVELNKDDFSFGGTDNPAVMKEDFNLVNYRCPTYEEGYKEAMRRGVPLVVFKNEWPTPGKDFVACYVTSDDGRFTQPLTTYYPKNGQFFPKADDFSGVKSKVGEFGQVKYMQVCGPNGCSMVAVPTESVKSTPDVKYIQFGDDEGNYSGSSCSGGNCGSSGGFKFFRKK